MAEALPEAESSVWEAQDDEDDEVSLTVRNTERSLWEAKDDDDDEVTLMVRKMKYEEVKGKRGGTFYHTPTDGHLYRFNRKGKDSKQFLACFHVKSTKDATIKEQCFGRAVLDSETREIKITTPHNHTPDVALLQKLNVRSKILQAAATSSDPLNEVFHDATRGMEGSEHIGYCGVYR